jgi:hypothetical protein
MSSKKKKKGHIYPGRMLKKLPGFSTLRNGDLSEKMKIHIASGRNYRPINFGGELF